MTKGNLLKIIGLSLVIASLSNEAKTQNFESVKNSPEIVYNKIDEYKRKQNYEAAKELTKNALDYYGNEGYRNVVETLEVKLGEINKIEKEVKIRDRFESSNKLGIFKDSLNRIVVRDYSTKFLEEKEKIREYGKFHAQRQISYFADGKISLPDFKGDTLKFFEIINSPYGEAIGYEYSCEKAGTKKQMKGLLKTLRELK
jgi:hypothetical protein